MYLQFKLNIAKYKGCGHWTVCKPHKSNTHILVDVLPKVQQIKKKITNLYVHGGLKAVDAWSGIQAIPLGTGMIAISGNYELSLCVQTQTINEVNSLHERVDHTRLGA